MSDLTKDLAEVVTRCEMREDAIAVGMALQFIRAHHAEIAQNTKAARRLAALEQAMCERLGDIPTWATKRAEEIMRGWTEGVG